MESQLKISYVPRISDYSCGPHIIFDWGLGLSQLATSSSTSNVPPILTWYRSGTHWCRVATSRHHDLLCPVACGIAYSRVERSSHVLSTHPTKDDQLLRWPTYGWTNFTQKSVRVLASRQTFHVWFYRVGPWHQKSMYVWPLIIWSCVAQAEKLPVDTITRGKEKKKKIARVQIGNGRMNIRGITLKMKICENIF